MISLETILSYTFIYYPIDWGLSLSSRESHTSPTSLMRLRPAFSALPELPEHREQGLMLSNETPWPRAQRVWFLGAFQTHCSEEWEKSDTFEKIEEMTTCLNNMLNCRIIDFSFPQDILLWQANASTVSWYHTVTTVRQVWHIDVRIVYHGVWLHWRNHGVWQISSIKLQSSSNWQELTSWIPAWVSWVRILPTGCDAKAAPGPRQSPRALRGRMDSLRPNLKKDEFNQPGLNQTGNGKTYRYQK